MRTLEGSSRLVDGEAAVIGRVRAGEREAYADLVRAHTRIAHRTAVLLGAGADAEDVVQSAFLKAYESLGRFREGAAFRPWLLRIVANETRNTVRSARRLRTAVGREAALAEAEPLIPESADPAAVAVAGERRARLLAALDELSGPQRQVVIYRYLLDLDEAETAQALGWPRGTVKSRLNRALRRLEALLGPEAEEWGQSAGAMESAGSAGSARSAGSAGSEAGEPALDRARTGRAGRRRGRERCDSGDRRGDRHGWTAGQRRAAGAAVGATGGG